MKTDKTKELFLEQLRKIPIIQVACNKAGIARSSVYRWRDESEEFRKAFEEALVEGEAMVNDMSESQLVSLIGDKNWHAISFWLRHRNPKFRERLEVTANLQTPQDELNPEQEELVREALRLASLGQSEIINNNKQNHEPNNNNKQPGEMQKPDSAGSRGSDDKGQESPRGNH